MNNFKITISPFAEEDLKEIQEWYNQKSSDLFPEFVKEFEQALILLKQNPLHFQVFRKDVRRIVLKRFPYSIFYKVSGKIIVLAVVHNKRHPKVIRKKISYMYSHEEISALKNCVLCPRKCGANRFSHKQGYCRSGAGFEISSVCIHKGEEPVISGEKGICNIFFPHCNLQCIFCQNHEISVNKYNHYQEYSYEELIRLICSVLDQTENIVGFVSPSHYVPQMTAIIRGIRETGRNPVFVYNTNGYDNVETLRTLEGIIDVYLPDFKYMDPALAFEYSRAKDYPEVASAALKEMYRQKGSTLIVNDNGIAESGIIVRHLVLPGAAGQSVEVLRYISEEISPKLYLSLMSQYYPTGPVKGHSRLNRSITPEEYSIVTTAFHEFGFYRGWVQDLRSHASYRPDFSSEMPFSEGL